MGGSRQGREAAIAGEGDMGWLQDNWQWIYVMGGLGLGALFAVATFFGVWWFASARYQLGGLVLGWIPGGIAGVVGGTILGFTWPVALVLAVLFGGPIVNAIGDVAADRV